MDRSACARVCSSRLSDARPDRIDEMLKLIHLRDSGARTRADLSPRPEAVAGDRHAADAGPEAAAARRARRRHDRRRDRTHGRAVPVARRIAFAGGRRARHEVHRRTGQRRPARKGRDRAARRQRARRGRAGDVQANERVVECILAIAASPTNAGAALPRPASVRHSSRGKAAPTDHAMLELKDVNQYYGGSHILRNVALRAKVGEITVVLGRNGVGKTTLLKASWAWSDQGGSITLDGQAIQKDLVRARAPRHRLRAAGPRIFGRLTVEDNLKMGLAYKSRRARRPGRTVRAVPGAEADAQPPRRRPLRAASNSNWPSPEPGSQPEAADPG